MNRTRPSALLAPVLAAACAAAVPAAAAGGGDSAAALRLAVVNGEPITLADVREAFGDRHSGHAGLLVGEEILRRVVEKAVEERLIIQEGRRMGIPEEPGFKEAVDAYRDVLLLEALERDVLAKGAEPSAGEVKAAYDLLPRQVHAAIIETRDRGKAEEARGRARIGEPFDDVARQISTHPSRTRGGDLGWISWGMLDPETEAVALAAAPGQVSDVFAAGGGFRVLKVLEERKGEPPPFAKVEERIRAILAARRLSVKRAALLASIRKAHAPVEDAPAIRNLLAAEPGAAPEGPDPADAAVLMRTATGLEVTAGYVRRRAARGGLAPASAWEAASSDALLMDEARRRIPPGPEIERRVSLYADGRIRDEVERTAILKGLAVSDAEVKALYDRDPAAFAAPASYHLRHVVLGSREEAEAVRRRIVAGEDFAAIARAASLDRESAGNGGDMGWVEGPRGAAGPLSAEGVLSLRPGETSGVIESERGFSVVQVLEVRPGAPAPFEQVRHDAAQRLIIEKQKALRDAFIARLRAASKVTVLEGAVARAVTIQDEAAARHIGARQASGGGNRP